MAEAGEFLPTNGSEAAVETVLALADRMENAAALERIARVVMLHKELAKSSELREVTERAARMTASLGLLLRVKGLIDARLTKPQITSEVTYGDAEEPTDVAYEAFEDDED